MTNGVISAGGQLTAEAGAQMLVLGGNAVDAAVAAAFMSFFAEIAMVHWGGSGIAMLHDPQTNSTRVYDFFSNMPGLGLNPRPKMLDFGPVTVDFGSTTQQFHLGRASVAVPGNIFGLCSLAAEKGSLPLATLLAPVIEAARNGITLNAYQASTCYLLRAIFTNTDAMRRIFAPAGRLLQAGDRLHIPDLADTLEALAHVGPSTIRNGRLAEALCADQAQHGGLITYEDLESYEVAHYLPLAISYRDYQVLLPPPSSIGGVLIAFTLKLLAAFDVRAMGLDSAETIRLLYEAKQATTRARLHLEHAAFDDDLINHVEDFLDDDYIAQYVQEVKYAIRNGVPTVEVPSFPSHPNTSHISVIDSNGMAIALTTTAGESAGYVVPETGFIVNNMLGEADLNPHGWHSWRAGQRIPTMMTPTLLMRDGKVVMATGSGGSERIRSALVQVISNFVDHQLPPHATIRQPRVHIENDVLQVEYGYREGGISRIESWGYPLNRWQQPSMYFGGAHSAFSIQNSLIGAPDPRRDGYTITV